MEDQPLQFHETLQTTDIKVLAYTAFNYAGRYDIDKITTAAVDFMRVNTICDSGVIEKIIREFLQQRPSSEAAWFTIRLSLPNHDFDISRWHRDGYMWVPRKPARKFAVTLIGPTTLLLESSSYIDSVMIGRNYEGCREELARDLDNQPRVNLEPCQVFSFICGSDIAPVHSEPPITRDRVFMSALPGTREQIQSLCKIRNWEYQY